jgi:hypothetical protein
MGSPSSVFNTFTGYLYHFFRTQHLPHHDARQGFHSPCLLTKFAQILPALVSENDCIPRKLLSMSPASLVVHRSQCLCLDNGKQTDTLRGLYMSGPQMELEMGIVNEKVASLEKLVSSRGHNSWANEQMCRRQGTFLLGLVHLFQNCVGKR